MGGHFWDRHVLPSQCRALKVIPVLEEQDIRNVAVSLADPALDAWVAMQDVAAEAEPMISSAERNWDRLDMAAVLVLCWMDKHGFARIGQYEEREGLVYWPERGKDLRERLLRVLADPGTDRESNRMNTLLCLTDRGVEWAKKITGRNSSCILRPAPEG